MLDPKILKKIKKCLALSQSPNPHEAATALRQAEALMRLHGVSKRDVALSDIGMKSIKSRSMSRSKPAQWEVGLAALIGSAFGCELMVERIITPRGSGVASQGSYIFVGLAHQVEVAAYTADVLIKRCKRARQTWIAENLSVLTSSGVRGAKAKATQMGDLFALGWVQSIREIVHDFANPPEVDALIRETINNETSGIIEPRQAKGKDLSYMDSIAMRMGQEAASKESIYRPMNQNIDPVLFIE